MANRVPPSNIGPTALVAMTVGYSTATFAPFFVAAVKAPYPMVSAGTVSAIVYMSSLLLPKSNQGQYARL